MNKRIVQNALEFIDYNKISIRFAYFDNKNVLKFTVKLINNNGNSYHKEYDYINPNTKVRSRMIDLDLANSGWVFGDSSNDKRNIFLNCGNTAMVAAVIKDKVIDQWFSYKEGKSIYTRSKDGTIVYASKKYEPVQIAVSDYKYMEFIPICTKNTETGVFNISCRLTINSRDNYIDLDVYKLYELYSCLSTSFPVLASIAANYVKTMPYGVNTIELDNSNVYSPSEYYFEEGRRDNFFTRNESKKQ